MNGRHRVLFTEEGDPVNGTVPGPEHQPSVPARAARALLRPASIKAVLNRILVVSLLLVLVAFSVVVTGQLSDYRAAVNTSRMGAVALSVQDLVHDLQKERDLTNGMLGGSAAFQPLVVTVRPETDSALHALHEFVDRASYLTDAAKVAPALAKMDELGKIRHGVDTRQAPADSIFDYYTDAIAALSGFGPGAVQIDDPNLSDGLRALNALDDAKEYTSQERGLLSGVFSGAPFPADQYAHLIEIRAGTQHALALYRQFATPAQQSVVDAVQHSPAATEAATFESIAVAGANGSLPQHVDAQAWWGQMTSVIDEMRTAVRSVGGDLTDRAQYLQNLALRKLIAYLLGAVIAIGLELALVIGAARSIVGPLARLADDADDVSRRRLPEAVQALDDDDGGDVRTSTPAPISVPSYAGTEIRQTARAVNRLQEAALSLAGEQAMVRRNTTVFMANLGHRNQSLVRRQLGLISDFEGEELATSARAKLFDLDHLATRMRRNAESLLVLVGASEPRPWSRSVSIGDVVRSSLSEVKDDRRITLKRIDEVFIAGSAVTDIAHMLAELLDNGLTFCPPDGEVEIYGRKVGNRYTVAVVDHGAGMTTEALVKANSRLHDEESFHAASTRCLGHYVVGRLARQLSIEVNLAPAPISGVTARLVLPPELLSDSPDRPVNDGAPVPPPAEHRPELAPGVAPAVNGRPRSLSGLSEALPPQQSRPADLTAPPLVQPRLPATWDQPAPHQPAPSHLVQPAAPGNERVRVDIRGERERTRNGLVKRQAKAARSRSSVGPTRPQVIGYGRPVGAQSPLHERTPSEVSSMISSYRAGHQRGTQGDTPVERLMPPPGRGSPGDAVARPVYPPPRPLHGMPPHSSGQPDFVDPGQVAPNSGPEIGTRLPTQSHSPVADPAGAGAVGQRSVADSSTTRDDPAMPGVESLAPVDEADRPWVAPATESGLQEGQQ